MKTFLLVCMMLLNSIIYAQIPTQKTLVADETWIVNSGKSAFKLIICNERTHTLAVKQFGSKVYKVAYNLKEDRHGKYWETTLYLKNDSWNEVTVFINNLNKKPNIKQ